MTEKQSIKDLEINDLREALTLFDRVIELVPREISWVVLLEIRDAITDQLERHGEHPAE